MTQNLDTIQAMVGKTIQSVGIEDGEEIEYQLGSKEKVLTIKFADGTEIRIKSSLGSQGVHTNNGGFTHTWPTLGVEMPQ